MHGDDFVGLAEDGLSHIDSLHKSKYTAKDMGSLGLGESGAKRLLLLTRVFPSGDRSRLTILRLNLICATHHSSSCHLDAT